MSGRGFFFHTASWALVCVLAATPLGALLGYMLGFVVVIFAAVLTTAGAYALFGFLGGLFGLVATIVAIAGWLRAFRGDWHGAFGWWSTAVAFTGIPLTVWLSMRAMHWGWFA
ncbi:MAG: hypothetical protein WDN24_15975 [Sphingomonas sp.]